MMIYGVDFSGAMSPKIHYAVGHLEGDDLTIERVVPCDDRLDVLGAIITRGGLWGLDVPFSLPAVAFERLGVTNWLGLAQLAQETPRPDFIRMLEALGRYEQKCGTPSLLCRATDCQMNAYSAVKGVNPNLKTMFYSGLKFLQYAMACGVGVYPLRHNDPSKAQVFEVYPSVLWGRVGIKRTPNLAEFITRFNAMSPLQVFLPRSYQHVATQDIADSVVACVMLASVIHRKAIQENWTKPPHFATPKEWAVAHQEGLIVRVEQ